MRGTALTLDSVAVPGVIVTLLDAQGTPVTRALSDAGGRFTMRAPSAGRYRIEAKRIAYRPTLDIPIDLETGKMLVHLLVLTGEPIRLATVQTVATSACQTNPDSASAAFALWEEARKALQASRLTRLTRGYSVDVMSFVRRESPNNPIRDSTIVTGLSIRPFTSKTPQELVDQGYLTRDGLNATFHAPDEEVLLSEQFAATHCLRILPDSGPAENVRLGFSPLPERAKTDITGALTLSRNTGELRRLDFMYVNVPSMPTIGDRGGQLVFRPLPEGSWIIDEWAIWVPTVDTRIEPSPTPPRVPAQRGLPTQPPPQRITTTRGVQVTGGRVVRVARGEETIWARQP